jgi:hypothetical protein
VGVSVRVPLVDGADLRQPSLPVLARILAAIDLEMRITLEDYDNHDDVLDAENNRLSADQRTVRRATQDQFAAQLRGSVTGR